MTRAYRARFAVTIMANPMLMRELAFIGLLTESVENMATELWGSNADFYIGQHTTTDKDADRVLSVVEVNTGDVPESCWSRKFSDEIECVHSGDEQDAFVKTLWGEALLQRVNSVQEEAGVPIVSEDMVKLDVKDFKIREESPAKRKWHVVKTFETEMSFDVEAESYDEACQKALDADKDDPLMNKDYRLTDEHVQSVTEPMPTWHFTVWERLQRGVSVEASNRESARDFVRRLIDDGQILLDDHDFSDSGFDLDERPDNPNNDKPDWYYIEPFDKEDDDDE